MKKLPPPAAKRVGALIACAISLSVWVDAQAQAQGLPEYSRSAVEQNLEQDFNKNKVLLQSLANYDEVLAIFEAEGARAELVDTKPVTQLEARNILCGKLRDNPNPWLIVLSPKCGFSPDEAKSVFDKSPLDTLAIERYEKALQIWQDLPSRGLFLKYLLSDILTFAVARKNLDQVEVKAGKLVFGDNLLDAYFGIKLSGSDFLRLGSKTVSLPNPLTFKDGRAVADDSLEALVGVGFRSNGAIPVERSVFASTIGNYTFAQVMMFMNYAANAGFTTQDEFFAYSLVDSLVGGFTPGKWIGWVDIFAFPAENSPRNIEYWFKVMPLEVKDSEYCTRYVDVDFRPQAALETPSTGSCVVSNAPFLSRDSDSNITYQGTLGSIRSENVSEFVGFTGIQIKSTSRLGEGECGRTNCAGSRISFDLDLQAPAQPMQLSVEILVESEGKQDSYVKEFSVNPGKNSFVNSDLLTFEKTVRGQRQGKFYQKNDRISDIRFFFKRSLNLPNDSVSLPVQFTIPKSSVARTILVFAD
jgi:hypothetical protein